MNRNQVYSISIIKFRSIRLFLDVVFQVDLPILNQVENLSSYDEGKTIFFFKLNLTIMDRLRYTNGFISIHSTHIT